MISFVPGMILIVTIPGALINSAVDGAQSLTLALWTVSGITILAILTRAYYIGAELDKLDAEDHKYTVRAHILLHVVPLTYFLIEYAMVPSSVLEAIYLLGVIVFFITGARTWKLCHGLFGTGLYKLFRIGNLQMLVFFPIAFASDITGWPAEGAGAFSDLMLVYFIVHFMLSGVTIPLMARDMRRYAAGSPQRGK